MSVTLRGADGVGEGRVVGGGVGAVAGGELPVVVLGVVACVVVVVVVVGGGGGGGGGRHGRCRRCAYRRGRRRAAGAEAPEARGPEVDPVVEEVVPLGEPGDRAPAHVVDLERARVVVVLGARGAVAARDEAVVEPHLVHALRRVVREALADVDPDPAAFGDVERPGEVVVPRLALGRVLAPVREPEAVVRVPAPDVQAAVVLVGLVGVVVLPAEGRRRGSLCEPAVIALRQEEGAAPPDVLVERPVRPCEHAREAVLRRRLEAQAAVAAVARERRPRRTGRGRTWRPTAAPPRRRRCPSSPGCRRSCPSRPARRTSSLAWRRRRTRNRRGRCGRTSRRRLRSSSRRRGCRRARRRTSGRLRRGGGAYDGCPIGTRPTSRVPRTRDWCANNPFEGWGVPWTG